MATPTIATLSDPSYVFTKTDSTIRPQVEWLQKLRTALQRLDLDRLSGTTQLAVQRVSTQTGAVATGTTLIPNDDTIPQNTEGNQYLTLSITPKSVSNILVIEHKGVYSTNAAGDVDFIVALFRDSTVNALAAIVDVSNVGTGQNLKSLTHMMAAGTTSSTTFKIRAGAGAAGTTTFNGQSGARRMGGVMASSLIITEYLV